MFYYPGRFSAQLGVLWRGLLVWRGGYRRKKGALGARRPTCIVLGLRFLTVRFRNRHRCGVFAARSMPVLGTPAHCSTPSFHHDRRSETVRAWWRLQRITKEPE